MINKKYLVLVIEDSPEIQAQLKKIITSTGKYKVVAAKNGYEGLYQLDKHKIFSGLLKNKIDCIIIDIKMPEMGGIEFIKRWRTIEGPNDLVPPMFRIPALFLSAYEDSEKRGAAISLKNGMLVDYLKKPIKKEQLLDTLKRILINKDTYSMQADLFEKRGVK